MNKTILLAAAAVLMSATASQAMPAMSAFSQTKAEVVESRVLSVGAERKQFQVRRAQRNHAAAFKGGRGPVQDTCPGGDKQCIKDLIAACDKADGGLSTQPDGGVDCYVVGIHDQP